MCGGIVMMSSQSFHAKIKLTNMDLKYIVSAQDNSRFHTSKHLNDPNSCKLCGGERAFDIETRRREPLVGHHVKYFPPVIAFVHYHCHKKIHDKENPVLNLIAYKEGDPRKYYELKTNYLKSLGYV